MVTKRLFHVERKEGFTRLYFRFFSEPAPSVQCFDLVDEAARVIVEEWELEDQPPFAIYQDAEGLNFDLLPEVSPAQEYADAFLFFHAELTKRLTFGQNPDQVMHMLMHAKAGINAFRKDN